MLFAIFESGFHVAQASVPLVWLRLAELLILLSPSAVSAVDV